MSARGYHWGPKAGPRCQVAVEMPDALQTPKAALLNPSFPSWLSPHERRNMPDWMAFLLLLVAWWGLQAFVLPKLGVPT